MKTALQFWIDAMCSRCAIPIRLSAITIMLLKEISSHTRNNIFHFAPYCEKDHLGTLENGKVTFPWEIVWDPVPATRNLMINASLVFMLRVL